MLACSKLRCRKRQCCISTVTLGFVHSLRHNPSRTQCRPAASSVERRGIPGLGRHIEAGSGKPHADERGATLERMLAVPPISSPACNKRGARSLRQPGITERQPPENSSWIGAGRAQASPLGGGRLQIIFVPISNSNVLVGRHKAGSSLFRDAL